MSEHAYFKQHKTKTKVQLFFLGS